MLPRLIRIHPLPVILLLALAGCAGMPNFPMRTTNSTVAPPPPVMPSVPLPAEEAAIPAVHGVMETKVGLASYYHPSLDGLIMASGVTFDNDALVAAHPSYPFGTVVRVTNLEKADAAVDVRVMDRGPTQENVDEGVIIDLSHAAAERLGMLQDGRIQVRVEVIEWGQEKYQKPQ